MHNKSFVSKTQKSSDLLLFFMQHYLASNKNPHQSQ